MDENNRVKLPTMFYQEIRYLFRDREFLFRLKFIRVFHS